MESRSAHLRQLFAHLCLAAQRLSQQQEARQALDAQMQKVRSVSLRPDVDAGTVHRELDRLEERMNAVMELENQILTKQQEYGQEIDDLRTKITRKRTVQKGTAIGLLRDRLKKLEKQHRVYVKSGKHDKAHLKRLEKKIQTLKIKIKILGS